MSDPSAVLRIVLLGVGTWILAVWAAGTVYIVATYAEAEPHVPRRSLAATLRSALLECWYVLWTQPMLPIFQVLGKRLGTGGGATPVVLVHGYFQNRVDFLYLAQRLRRAGSGPLFACNFFWPQSLENSSASVRDFVEGVLHETGAERVDLLTHSSGGLLALDLLAEHPEWIRRIVVIAVPWQGVTWRGPVLGRSGSQLRADSLYTQSRPSEVTGGPVLSIYSAHDNLVHPARTSCISGPDTACLEVQNLGHLAVLFDRAVGDAVSGFLVPSEQEATASASSSGSALQ